MRILYLQYGNPQNPFSRGGVSQANHQMLKHLALRHEITVFTGPLAGNARRQVHDGISYCRKALGTRSRWLSRLSFVIWSLAFVTDRFDAVVVVWTRFAPILTRIKSQHEVLELHAAFFDLPPRCTPLDRLSRWLLRRRLRRCGTVIGVSEHVLRNTLHQSESSARSRVIYNGVDRPTRPTSGRREYWLFLGGLNIEVKGIDILLRAFAQARTDLPLRIAGDGPDLAATQALIDELHLNDRVELLGWVDTPRKEAVIAGAFALCVPSRSEGWGLVAVEASMLGKPVIAAAAGGLQEAVVDERSGLLVPVGDVAAFAEAMSRLATDPVLWQTLSEGARQHASGFSFERSAKEREALFAGIDPLGPSPGAGG